MSGILLGPIANNTINNKLESIYNSNISGKMNMIERNQSMQASKYNSKSGFLNQFDDLRFDNIGEPVGVNEAFTTLNGVNSSLQRNLDFQRGYSDFQKNDMHYGVVDKNEFTHGNMIPNTSRRDFDNNSDRIGRKLETFTGAFQYYQPKKESVHLFEPMTDLTYIHGMPSITENVKNRYLPSNKNNNGNLPFETNIRVLPGLDNENQMGGYSVYRILPKNVDTLRSDTNQKISYENKPLETIKKGEVRGPNPNLTKFKMPDFRETKFEDLIPSKSSIEAPKNTGTFTNVYTMRNENDTYNPINAVNTNIGDGPDKGKTRFEPSKRENYLNDNTHGIGAIYNKPVMTNAKSFINYENQRASTNIEYEAPVGSGQTTGYTIDYKDVPLTTARELMIYGNNVLGIKSEQKSYVFSNDMVLPVTNRQIKNTLDILGPSNEIKHGMIYNNDQAKVTIKQGTNYNDVSNATGEIKNGMTYNNDQAKVTIRQNTNYNNVSNVTGEIKQGITYNNDQAKVTIKQGTNYNDVSNATGEIKQGLTYNNDQAKVTIRQGTNYNDVSNATGEIKHGMTYNNDQAKVTIRQNTNYNNVSNATGEIKQSIIYNNDQAKNTIRQNTNYNNVSNATGEYKHGLIYNDDMAKPTIKQSTIVSNYSGTIGGCNNTTYTRDINDSAKPTIRQQTENIQYIGHANANNIESTYVRDLETKARTTIKEQTEKTQHIGHANANNIESTYVRDLETKAKTTIREQTEETNYTGVIKSNDQEGTYIKNYNDIAKPTIKQTTIAQTPAGRVANSNMGNYASLTDNMKTTIKETTLTEDYTGVLHGEVEKPISHDATNNVCLDDRREISTYNRAPNGKSDANGPIIDRDNVRLNEPILYSYVPNPHKSLDHSVMPTVSRNTIEKIYSMSKPVIESSSYYINPYFINTLKNNPLVNDIYHQKNV